MLMNTKVSTQTSELTADIVSAYVGRNKVSPQEIPNLIAEVHKAIVRAPQLAAKPAVDSKAPAVSIKQSAKKDYIVCLEDGQRFKSLKRHLRNEHDLTPEEYRAKWGLPRDYPMVAPSYSETRSNLARSMGLGRKSATAAKKNSSKKRSRS
jgi:predicted transcriptional regulator